MKKMYLAALAGALIAGLAGLSGCSALLGLDTTTEVAVTSVSIPATASLEVGATQALTVTVLPADADDKTVVWSSSATSIATVSANGVVTAVAAGTATITVTSVSDSSKTDSCVVTVTATASPELIVNGTFTSTTDSWTTWSDGSTISLSATGGQLVAVVGNPNVSASYNPKFYQAGLAITNGTKYELSFDVKATVARDIRLNIGKQLTADPWFTSMLGTVPAPTVSVGTTMTTKSFVFVASYDGTITGDVIFELGAGSAATFTFDNISLKVSTKDIPVSTTALTAAITAASSLNTATSVGTSTGNVPQGAKDTFTAAIATAQAEAAAPTSQATVDAAVSTLTTATSVFSSAIIATVGTSNLLASFDESTPPVLTDFGNASSSIVTDPADTLNQVAKTLKPAGAETWAGTTISTGYNQSIEQMIVTSTDTNVSVRIYSPAIGKKIRLKAENASDNNKTHEVDMFSTVANAWETIVFDFATPATGTNPFNTTDLYNKLSIFFDFGVAPSSDETFYFDDVTFLGNIGSALEAPAPVTAPSSAASTPTLLAANVVNLYTSSGTYTNPSFGNWSESWANTAISDDTTSVSGITLKKIIFTLSNGFTGSTLAATKDITGKKTLHVDYFTPDGTKISAKIVDFGGSVYTDGSITQTSVAASSITQGSWQSLELDFNAQTVGTNIGQILFEADGATGTYWFDNIYFH